MQLLNQAELESRLNSWLKAAAWTREVCGRWIFTWNAFQIECEPLSVLKAIESLDLRTSDLREGAPHRDSDAKEAGTLVRKAGGPKGDTFSAVMQIDPEAIRLQRAEGDVSVGEILQKPLTMAAALRQREKESVTGTVSVTFDTDADGNAWRRTRVVSLRTEKPDRVVEKSTATQIVTRRKISLRKQ